MEEVVSAGERHGSLAGGQTQRRRAGDRRDDDRTNWTNTCRAHWEDLSDKLLAGTYVPSPVRRVEIPKPNGGTRMLGIPTVLDRLIQQMLLQVLTPIFDPTIQRAQLRVPAGAQRARRGASRAGIRRREARTGWWIWTSPSSSTTSITTF